MIVVALLSITACNSKSSSSSSTDNTNAAATAGAQATTGGEASPAATTAAGEIPTYPGATTQAAGSSSNMMGSAAGKVMSTDDSFDKVYAWYQQNMPAGSEKAHTTSPMQSAVFTLGESGKGQTSVTITVSGGKTVISIAKVKM
jgi:hypothetical protein